MNAVQEDEFEFLDALTSQRRHVLERAADVHRSSATILRRKGRESAARRAELAASRVRLTIDEPRATFDLWYWVRAVRADRSPLERVVDGTLALLGADFAGLQLRAHGAGLRIASHSGFAPEFLDHFSLVDDDSSACGRAAAARTQVVVADVRLDAAFAPHRDAARAAGFCAVQSTPVVGADGRLTGVISGHFRHTHQPTAREMQLIAWFADTVAGILSPAPTAG